MPYKLIPSILLLLCMIPCAAPGANRNLVNLGPWSNGGIAQIIAMAAQFDAPGARIAAISGHFIDTPYVADTLIGGPQTAELLVINLAGVDCFTFLDQVEALRRATDLVDLPEQLKQVRYRDGKLAYENRRHFFSDWVADDAARIVDVTAAVGQGRERLVFKQLNLKRDGNLWLAGIPVRRREISYIPSNRIDKDVLSGLEVGDYVGIYTDEAGLDVSHTGLIVKAEDSVLLRHASSLSSARRVVDVDLLEYLQGKPGLVIYRVKSGGLPSGKHPDKY